MKNTLADVKIDIGIKYSHVLDLTIESEEGRHAVANIVFEVQKKTTDVELKKLRNQDIKISIDEKTIFSGICISTNFSALSGYYNVIIKCVSKSYLMDRKKENRRFQNPSVTIKDVIDETLKDYGMSIEYGNNTSLGQVISQNKETDWEFIKRVAATQQMSVFVDARDKAGRIFIGKTGFRTFSDGEKSLQSQGVSRNLTEMGMREANGEDAQSYTLDVYDSTSTNLEMSAGDKAGEYVIRHSTIKNEGGVLRNYINYGYSYSVRPDTASVNAPQESSSVLTGTVTAVSGNMIQVAMDSEVGGGGQTWIPYESFISNSFYCMPDIGDIVFIYYENNGNIVCLGSKHTGTDSPDFSKPNENVFTSKNKMIKHEEKALKITATRDLCDAESEQEITIIMSDEDGITINSGRDINIKSDMNIVIGAKTPADADDKYSSGKKKLEQRINQSREEYVSSAGILDYAELTALQLCGQVADSGLEQLKSAVFYDLWHKDSDTTSETINQSGDYESGVLTLYGYESAQLAVGVDDNVTTGIRLDSNLSFSAKKFIWLGYEQGEHEKEEKPLQDWWETALDGLQLALDIAGCFPVFGAIPDLINAGISFARGDFIGGGASLLAAIPFVGDAVGAAKVAVKGTKLVTKAMKYISKAEKLIKYAKGIYSISQGLYAIYQTKDGWEEIYNKIENGENPWDDPETWSTIFNTGQGAVATGKAAHDMHKSVKESGGGDGQNKKTKEENADNANGDGTNKNNEKDCGDPINMVTGSLTMDYADFAVNDINEPFILRRMHESIHSNEGMMLGNRWYLNIETRLTIEEDRISMQKMDMTLEHFILEDDKWVNENHNGKAYILTKQKDYYEVFEDSSRKTYKYDLNGKILEIVDNCKNKTVFKYENDKLVHMSFTSGQWLKFEYNDGKLCKITDTIGRTVEYGYEGKLLTWVKLANGGKISYEYDKYNCIHQIVDQNDRPYVTTEYDHRRRAVRQTLITGEEYVIFYDDKNKRTTFSNLKNGSTVIYEYGVQKVPTKEIYEDGTYIEKKYDDTENCIYYRDRNGNETFTEYDDRGNVTLKTYPDKSFEKYTYDDFGNLIAIENSDGSCEKFTYNDKNLLTSYSQRIAGEKYSVTKYEYDRFGRVTAIINPNGNRVIYGYEENNLYNDWSYKTLPENEKYIRKYDKAGRCIEETNEFGTKYISYTPLDDVCTVTEPEEQRTEYIYDLLGNLKEKRLPKHGNAKVSGIKYVYDGLDHVIQEISPMGNVYAYEYGNEDELIRSIHPVAYAAGKKDGIAFEYDIYGNKVKTIYPDGGIESRLFDANGNIIRRVTPEGQNSDDAYIFEYDCMNRVTRITSNSGKRLAEYKYDAAGRIIEYIGEGKEYPDIFTYNFCGWLVAVRKAMEQTEAGDVRYNLVTYSYDDMGNRISVKRYLDYQSVDSAKGRCHEIRYKYDRSNRLVEVNDSTGAKEEYVYDVAGRLKARRSLISENIVQETCYKYDRSDRIIEVWERMEESAKAKYGTGYSKAIYKYDENDNVVSITMPDGGVITYEHDADDHVVKERHKDATGIDCTIEYEYDNAGNVTVKRTEGGEERYSYDYMNREIRYIDGEGGITTRSYDLNGRMKKFIDPNENAKVIANAAYNAHGYTYSYDAEDRLLSIVGPDGFAMESNIYDLSGNLSVKVDAEGNQVRFDYDLAGRNIKITSPGGSIQKFSYDAVGNIESSTDGCGETTCFTNDAWGRATEIIRADEAVERYEYDFAGNIIKATDAEGNTVNYSFGERNLLVSRTDVFGETEKFCYDKTGNLASHTDRNGNKITYEYNMYRSPVSRTARADGLDSIVEQYSYDKIGRLISAISDGRRYDYRYDNSNRIIEKSVGGRNLVSYTYDANGNITTLTDVTGKRTRYEYDLLGRTTSVKDEASDFFALYEYTKNGNVKSVSTPVIKSRYEYDADGKMTSLFTATSGLDIEKILANNTYRYDKNGNRTEKTTLAGTTKYTYDVLGQLISETSSNVNNVYSYDKAGNRTALQGVDSHEVYIYDRGRLSGRTIHNSKGIATYNYTYDAQGNTLSDGENTYLYDCLNRISQVTTKAGDIQKNHYDVEGLRDQMEENGNLVRFIYSGREVIVEEDAAGERIRYIRGHELLATDSESARTYYHYACDEMGSITHLTDEDGNVLNHYEYDAFGNQVVAEESVKNRFGFAGEIRDALTGQYYLRARFYNPVIARFISEDTYYGDGLNLYVYCHNNPVGYVDPSGHLCKEKYNAIESLRDRDGSNAGDALKKYKELRKEGYTPDQIKNGDYRESGNKSRQLLTGEEWYQYFKEQYGAKNVQGSVYNWSQAELQSAMDEIYKAGLNDSIKKSKNGVPYNGGPRQTITVTTDGKVIISQNSSAVNSASRAVANKIFGDDVIFVKSGKNNMRPGMEANLGNHAETKGIYWVESNGGSTEGAKQVSSHYSCDSCRDTQRSTGVMNYTGNASSHNGVQKRIKY